jgi:hypothetical protein
MVGIVLRLDLLVEQSLPRRTSLVAQRRDLVDRIDCQTVPIRSVADGELQWGINVTFLPVSTHKHVVLTLTAICETVNQPRVRMEIEDARSVLGEDGLPLMCFETVRVLARINELEQVDDVDKADFEVREMCAQERSGSERLMSPQDAMTTSGSSPLSLEAHSQTPTPFVQWAIACSMVRY